jgi:hypothetical protein
VSVGLIEDPRTAGDVEQPVIVVQPEQQVLVLVVPGRT